jgi:hypothetical protein
MMPEVNAMESSLEYWTTRLAVVRSCCFPRLDGARDSTERQSISIDIGTLAELRKFGDEKGLSLHCIMQAAWGCVLRAYTGFDSVCFGYVASGQCHDQLQMAQPPPGLSACLIDFTDRAPLEDVLQKVQCEHAEAEQRRHCTFAQIQEALHRAEPLFNTVLHVHDDGDDTGSGRMIEFAKTPDTNYREVSAN